MSGLEVIGRLDPNFGWSRSGLLVGDGCETPEPPRDIRGAFACVTASGATVRVVRAPLGLNKLFWVPGEGGTVRLSARLHTLCSAGHELDEIGAVPAGSAISIDLATGTRQVERLVVDDRPDVAAASVETLATLIRETLDQWCAALAAAHPGRTVFVCLSGGLDSAGALVLAREHFADVVAVSFDLERPRALGRVGASADRRAAERLARELGIPLLCVSVSEEALLEGLDTALREGMDWRDFNVHAALVNVALARGIVTHLGTLRAVGESARPLVITGDLPNEYLCDYKPERYLDRTYYLLPRLPPAELRWYLVRGLETTHREVGPFWASDLPLVQVYAPVAGYYLALPDSFLADPARKERLADLVFGNQIPSWVHARPKTRAQIGDPDGKRSVLAACVDRGVDQSWLRRRFAELHNVHDSSALDRLVRGGRYRASVPTPTAVGC